MALQRRVQRGTHCGQVLRREQSLAAFKQLPFLFADVSGEKPGKFTQAVAIQFARLGAAEIVAQQGVLAEQLVHQRLKLRKISRRGEQGLLLSGEMPADFQVEHGADLRLQGLHIRGSGLQRAVNLDAQGQRVLVLMRKWDQVRVAQHGAIIPRALLIFRRRREYLFALSAGKEQGEFMAATGELIRLMNYVDDISTTLRRIVATIPMMDDDERKRLADYIRKVEPTYDSVLQQLEKGGK